MKTVRDVRCSCRGSCPGGRMGRGWGLVRGLPGSQGLPYPFTLVSVNEMQKEKRPP